LSFTFHEIIFMIRQFQKNKIPKTTTLLYAYKSFLTNCLLTQSRRDAENERRLIKGVGILIFWSYLIDKVGLASLAFGSLGSTHPT